ncbi:MAG: hypothetical protein HY067_09925 [Betaproteobacteria bacterium]|nr:hypothetical protein [Betaproteobacteria bacterium]
MVAYGTILHAVNRTKDIGLFLIAVNREQITDLMEYASSKRADQASRLDNSVQSEIMQLEVHGKHAFRFDVTGNLKGSNKMSITYRHTLMEGDKEVAHLSAWTSSTNFDKQKEAINSLSEDIDGL